MITRLKIRISMIPKDEIFKRRLRETLMRGNPYASHWVDAVIRTVYLIHGILEEEISEGKS